MAKQPNQSSQVPPEEENDAKVYSVSQDQNGSLHFTRRDFLMLGMAAGGALLVKGVCPRFGEGTASTGVQPVQSGMMPFPKVYLHARPSIDSDIVDSLQQNDLVLLIGDHPDLGWVEVATRSGKQGWLKRTFVDFSRAITQASRDFGFSKQLESRPEALQSTNTPTPTNTPTSVRMEGLNLALGKTATASSVEDDDTSNLGPQNAVDGDPVTRWGSAFSDPQWIQIDLGELISISHVRLSWEVAYAQAYQIQISTDGSTWTDIFTVTDGVGGVDDLSNLTGIGQYIRMYATVRGTEWGYSLYEFEVYGMPVAFIFLPVVVNGAYNTPTPSNTPTATSTPGPCTCNSLPTCSCNSGNPCSCDTAAPNCACNGYLPCACDTAIPNCACHGYLPCTCNTAPCSCNIAPCSCNIAPCSCNIAPCSCNISPCSCNSNPIFCACNSFTPCSFT